MKRSAILIFATLLAVLKTAAQPKADFTADITGGCSPIKVQFQNRSTGITGAADYFWDLGNGATSGIENPGALYIDPGVYRVSLRVITNAGKDSLVREAYITVYEKPQPDFAANIRAGCTPTAVQFSDKTVAAPSTTNVTWNWDFGDGTSSTEQNPQHLYTTANNYAITLKVTSDKGCSNLVSQDNFITISEGVVPQFTNTQPTVCKPPASVTFTNTSTGPAALSYLWDFGNGKTSTRKNPTISFDATGNYPVKLVVRSSTGCADSVTMLNAVTVTSFQVTTNFHVPPICPGATIQLTDSSSITPTSRLWKFSDGTTDAAPAPTKVFSEPGTYNITLLNTYGTCTDSITKKIKIGLRPEVGFSAKVQNSCQVPFNVSFSNTSKGAASYQWSFGDGTFSTDAKPKHAYVANGSFPVTLIATNAGGCADTLTQPAFINIQQPVVYFKKLPERGCIPYSTQFFDSVISADPVVSYKWTLGDGSTSTAKAPKHNYNKQGTYAVSLTIKTASGCTATGMIPNGVKVGTKPGKIDFGLSDTIVCAIVPIRFFDSSVKVDEWQWEFGDGGTSNLQNPTHLFTNIGTDTVKLTAYNSGCKAKQVVKKAVTIKAPIAIFSSRRTNCTDLLTYSFTNTSLTSGTVNLTWSWNFGDGTTSDLRDPGPHTFPGFGTYPVTLVVTNNDCSYNTAQTIVIADHTTDFSAPQTGCKPFTTTFTPSDLANKQIVAYTWNFGDGTSVASPAAVAHVYNKPGSFDVSLITTDVFGCKDTSAVKPNYIRVNGPTARFSTQGRSGCANLTTTFQDSSVTDGQNALTNWLWEFGDSSKQSFNAPPFEHQYNAAGVFTVKLKVQDAAGCTDSLTLPNYIKTSVLKANWTSDEFTCPGAPVQFISVVTTPIVSSIWDFGNGVTSDLLSPSISYPDTGTFTVKLILADSLGCKDSLVRPEHIKVHRPKAGFTENNLTSYCVPFQALFTNTSTYSIASYWDLGGTTSTQLNPVSIYPKIGAYNIKLRVTSPGGCSDSLVKTLNVYNIKDATFTYGPSNFGCRPLKLNFDAFTELKGRFIWDFGDGSVVDTTVNKMTHTFETAGTFLPKIVLQEPSGCVVALTGNAPITVNGAKVKFGIDKKFFCDSGLVEIRDSSITQGANVNYNWDFGDGTTSTDPAPGAHFYNKPGQHRLKLTVKTGEGCVDTVSIPGVFIAVTPQIHITGDSVVCVNSEIQSAGIFDKRDSAEVIWSWQLPGGSSSNLQAPPPIAVSTPGSYPFRAIATSITGCADTAYQTVVVHPRPTATADFPSSVTTQAGFPIKLEGTYPPNIKGYTWRPTAGLSCTDCPFPFASPGVNTKYIVEYVDSNNCKNTAMVQVIVLCKNANVFVPNTFSPNGDGKNDVFYIRGRGLDRVKSLRVFDRWGEVVFEKKDFSVNDPVAGWNGRYKDGNPKTDVYIYQIEVFCENGDLIRFDGNVALIL